MKSDGLGTYYKGKPSSIDIPGNNIWSCNFLSALFGSYKVKLEKEKQKATLMGGISQESLCVLPDINATISFNNELEFNPAFQLEPYNAHSRIAGVILNTVARFLLNGMATEDVPDELRICFHVSTRPDEIGHHSTLLANVKQFKRFYKKVHQCKNINPDSFVKKDWGHDDLLRVREVIDVGLGFGKFVKIINKDSINNADLIEPNSAKTTAVLTEICKDNQLIEVSHLDSLQGSTFHFQKVKQQLNHPFYQLQSVPCSAQRGLTCCDHSIYNVFALSVFNFVPRINEAGTLQSEDLRRLFEYANTPSEVQGEDCYSIDYTDDIHTKLVMPYIEGLAKEAKTLKSENSTLPKIEELSKAKIAPNETSSHIPSQQKTTPANSAKTKKPLNSYIKASLIFMASLLTASVGACSLLFFGFPGLIIGSFLLAAAVLGVLVSGYFTYKGKASQPKSPVSAASNNATYPALTKSMENHSGNKAKFSMPLKPDAAKTKVASVQVNNQKTQEHNPSAIKAARY